MKESLKSDDPRCLKRNSCWLILVSHWPLRHALSLLQFARFLSFFPFLDSSPRQLEAGQSHSGARDITNGLEIDFTGYKGSGDRSNAVSFESNQFYLIWRCDAGFLEVMFSSRSEKTKKRFSSQLQHLYRITQFKDELDLVIKKILTQYNSSVF